MKQTLYIFPTCIGNLIYKKLIPEVKNFLEKRGYRTEILKKPFCCGQVFYNSGKIESAKEIAHQLNNLWKNKKILFFSGSCLEYVIKKIPELTEKSTEFTAIEITDFFTKEKLIPVLPEYHVSCHFKTLKKDTPEFLTCCGFGGIFSAIYPEISEKILKTKFSDKEIISIEPGCSFHMQSKGFKTKHPLENVFDKK